VAGYSRQPVQIDAALKQPEHCRAIIAKAVSELGGVDILPAELAAAYVVLADPLSSFVSGATIAVTGGKPFL
jgi:NAD(P)-dependent dehydrogenase (short-subunit alcohol dehydrogenase family)